MPLLPRPLPAVPNARGRWRAFWRDTSGLAAVEFALVLPIMLTLWLGGVEFTQALSVDRRVNNMASTIGDLAARERCLSNASVDEMFDLADAGMFPYDAAPLNIVLSGIDVDEDGKLTVGWSRAHGSKPKRSSADNAMLTTIVDEKLRVPDSQIILSEAYYNYEPTIGYVLTGAIEFSERFYFVPRLVPKISLKASQSDCAS